LHNKKPTRDPFEEVYICRQCNAIFFKNDIQAHMDSTGHYKISYTQLDDGYQGD